MTFRTIAAVAFLFLATQAAAQQNTPDYIKADRAIVERAFGIKATAIIFSDNLTQARREFIERSLKANPAAGCFDKPQFVITHVVPLQVGTQGKIWSERFDISCQPHIRRNWIIAVPKEGDVKTQESFPGDTIADLKLQRDAAMSIGIAATSKIAASCKDVKLLDTQVSAKPSIDKSWQEVWVYSVCGKKSEVEVRFGSGLQGGTVWTATAR